METTEELSDVLARIVEEAQAAHRPRQLFGIALKPGAPKTPAVAQPTIAAAPKTREPLSRARVEAFKQCYQIIWEQLQGRSSPNHPWVLVYHAREAEGTLGLLDALETHLMRGGAVKIQGWLREMSKNSDSAVALAAVLAASAAVSADRVIGILLLTSDAEGGVDALGEVLAELARGVDSSLHLAHFLETCSRHARAGRGLVELLDTLAGPVEDEWQRVGQLAVTFHGMSATVGGSRRLAQMLENLCEVEDARPALARLLHRLSRTSEGAAETVGMLRNFANDKDGASQLSRVLARLAETRPGAGELIKALAAMPARQVLKLLVDLVEGSDTGRFLVNLTRETFNAYALQYLLDRLAQESKGRKLLHYVFSQLANCQRRSAQYRLFESRLAALNLGLAS